MVIDLGSGASIEIIYPVLDPRGMETNTASIVGRLKYGAIKFLLTGDSPKNIEDYLVAKIEKSCGEIEVNQCESNIIRSDVLKVGHHGSNTSTGENFVKTVNPQYAIISAGKDNRYGHPHQEVIENLTSNKVEILNTAELGRIIFKTDGQNLILKK
jgi:competence protein ComEC